MRKNFQDPSDCDLGELHRQIATLHDFVTKLVAPDQPRLVRHGQFTFGELLEGESLEALPLNPEQVLERLASYFQGQVRWNHPGTMINVTPPPTLTSVAAGAYVSLVNPNGAQDMSSGMLLGVELAVVKMLSDLAGFDEARSGGVFTFGGTSTNLHAVKHGLQRAQPDARRHGIRNTVRVISSTQGHPCHEEVCGWLGIGESACLRVPTRADGSIDLDALDASVRRAIHSGEQVATIFANGGTTIQMLVDPIGDIVALRDTLVRELGLNYTPRVHVDSVVGWVWLFFRDYDYDANPLDVPAASLARIQAQAARISEVHLADSFGVDFHKTGFAPYATSVYVAADRNEIYEQGGLTHADHPIGAGGRKGLPYEELRYGQNSPFQYTLELSRPLTGPVQAYANLKVLGIEGYQRLIAGLVEASDCFARVLEAKGRFEVISRKDASGFAVLFVAKPTVDTRSVFDSTWDRASLTQLAQYNYDFYRYLFEQQSTGRCRIACDYSSGYHTLAGGARIGVMKSYPMSPFYDEPTATRMATELGDLLEELDAREPGLAFGDGPHVPRPMTFRPGNLP